MLYLSSSKVKVLGHCSRSHEKVFLMVGASLSEKFQLLCVNVLVGVSVSTDVKKMRQKVEQLEMRGRI